MAVTALGLSTVGCGGQEQWGPFKGRLVNSETGEPIAGGLVFVYWQRKGLSGTGDGIPEFIAGQEAVTDADGWFHAPGIPRVWKTAIDPPVFGKYVPWFRHDGDEVSPPDGRPYVDPTVVKMRPLKTFQERCSAFPLPSGSVPQDAYPKVMASYQAALSQCNAEERKGLR